MSSASGLFEFFYMKQGKILNMEKVVFTGILVVSRLRKVKVSEKRSRIPFLLHHTLCPTD
jgi:hypothetical protein